MSDREIKWWWPTKQVSREELEEMYPTDYTTEDGGYMGCDPAKMDDRTAVFLWSREAAKYRAKRARRHSWFVAFGITLFLCVAGGIAYLATDSVFLKVVVCLVAGCG